MKLKVISLQWNKVQRCLIKTLSALKVTIIIMKSLKITLKFTIYNTVRIQNRMYADRQMSQEIPI